MPNHITNLVTLKGPKTEIETILQTHVSEAQDQKFFDFRTVVPVPECVSVTESGSDADLGFYALTGLYSSEFGFERNGLSNAAARFNKSFFSVSELLGWMKKNAPDALVKGDRNVTCFRETGHLNWYDWNIANWGTKWNSYEYEQVSQWLDDGQATAVVRFQTAWSPPGPIFRRLSEMYPGTRIGVEAVDEGGPEYVGTFSSEGCELQRVEESRERRERVNGCPDYNEDDEESSQG